MLPVTVIYNQPLFVNVSTEALVAENVPQLRNAPLITHSDSPKLIMKNSTGRECLVSTINEMRAAEDDGYFGANNAQMRVQAFFSLIADLLSAVLVARPSTASHLATISNATLLPARYVSLFADFEELQVTPDRLEISVADLVAQNSCKIVSADQNTLAVEAQVLSTLTEVLRGDLDGDGVEDMLVWQRSRIVGGTMHWSNSFALTRLTDNSQFSKVRLPFQ